MAPEKNDASMRMAKSRCGRWQEHQDPEEIGEALETALMLSHE